MRRDPLVLGCFVLVGVAVAVGAGAGYLSPAWVERVYSRGLVPPVARGIGRVTGLVGVSVTEYGAIGLAIVGAVVTIGRWREPRFWAGVVGVAAAGWLVFQAVWGLNYRREPIAGVFGLVVVPSRVDELRVLATELVTAANTRRPTPRTAADAVRHALEDAPAVYTRAAVARPVFAGTYAPPKPLVFSGVLSWLGLLGFYSPFTAEPNINVDAPGFVLPFVVLHEMAHQRGVASEDEANFVGYLLGRDDGDPWFAYSCLWEGFTHAVSALGRVDPDGARAVWDLEAPDVRADSEAYQAWRAAHASPLEDVARLVNDTYLKSQGVPDGVRSYGRVVDLMLAERRQRP